MSAQAFESFKRKYALAKGRPFDTGVSREFVYECLTESIYNTELVLCEKGVKPVSRFIVESPSHADFLRDWAVKRGMAFSMRPLSSNENAANLNPRIRFVGYFSKRPELVDEAMLVDARAGKDFEYRIGRLLGYPDCCNLAWSRSGNIPKEADRTHFFFDSYIVGALPENNPFFNFTFRSLSFFYPCSLSCPAASETHRIQAAAIAEDAPEFYGELVRLHSFPIAFFWPKRSETLTLNLHFDEIFRVHFIGKEVAPGIVAYADFFLTSLSFLDQPNEPEYAADCVRVLESLLLGDNVGIARDSFSIRKGKMPIRVFSHEFSRYGRLPYAEL